MNCYRLIGDLLHLFSILYLLTQLIKTRSCRGISGKTQLLFAIVYTIRYLDLLTVYISPYNSGFKIIFMAGCYATVLLIFVLLRKTYNQSQDTFLTELLLTPCFIVSLCFTNAMETLEILWTLSIYLESVAIIPQFYMIYKKREVQKSLLFYLVSLGLYRLFYDFNWIYRYITEGHFDPVSTAGGILYVTVYALALVLFCAVKIKVTNTDIDNNSLGKGIFYISIKPMNEMLYNEEKAGLEQPLQEKI